MEFEPFSVTELLTGGILLISLEVFMFSFFIIWFGFASIVIAGVTLFYPFESGTVQLGYISIIALTLFFILAKPLKERLMKPAEKLHDEKREVGVLKNNRIMYSGTFWNYHTEDRVLEGDEVEIIKKDGNTLIVKSLENRE